MAEIYVDIRPQEEWRKGLTRDQLIEEMSRALAAIPGIEPAFSQPIRVTLSGLLLAQSSACAQ